MKGSWDCGRDPLGALQSGDPRPFEAFVAAASGALLGFFRRQGAGEAEAEDLTQDVFLKLFRHASTYQPSGRFTAFAFRIARNAWIDRQRRRGPADVPAAAERGEAEAGLAATPDPGGAPGERLEQIEEAQRVERALQKLSHEQRMVFELGVLRELPYAEIAVLLDIPEGTVKSRMHYALKKLREELAPPRAEDRSAVEQRSAS